MSNKKYKIINNTEPLKIWIWLFVAVFFISLLSYGYFIRVATINIVARQNMEAETSVLNSKVVDLESKYIKDKNDITLEKAYSLGFMAVSNQKYVTRNTEKPGLSLVTTGL